MWAHLHIDWHVAYARLILMKLANVLDNALICLRWHRGLSDPWTSVLSGQREARPALLLLSPWGFLTQNKQKVCFLGLLKSWRHLVLYRGQIIYHSALPCSASVALLFSDFYNLCCFFFHCCWPLHNTQILCFITLDRITPQVKHSFHFCIPKLLTPTCKKQEIVESSRVVEERR